MKPKYQTLRLLAGTTLSFTMAGLLTQSALADYDWTGAAANGLYSDAGNWSGTATDNNFIDNGDTATVDSVIAWNPNDLKIATKGGALTTPTSGAVSITTGSLSTNYWTFVGDWAGTASLSVTGDGSYTTGAFDGNGNIHVGLYGSTGTLTVDTTGTVTASGIYVAPNNTTNGGALPTSGGTFNLDNGTVNVSGDMQVGSDFWGAGDFSNGHFNMTGGELNVGGLLEVGHLGLSVTSGTSDATISGGVLNVENDLKLGFAGNTGTAAEMTITGAGTEVNVASATTRWVIMGQYDPTDVSMEVSNGGALNLEAGTDIMFGIGGNSGTRLLDVDGGSINSAGGSVIHLEEGTTAGTSTMNIHGGSLVAVDQITGGAVSTLNLDDASLQVTDYNDTYLNTNFIDLDGGTVNVGAGGLAIDTNTFDATIQNTLLEAPTTGGDLDVTGEGKLTLAGGADITGTTTVAGFTGFGGDGSLGGPLVLLDDAKLDFLNGAPDDLLTVPSLTFGEFNELHANVGGSNADQIAITGAYSAPVNGLTNPVSVNLAAVGGLQVGARTLISNASGIDLDHFVLDSTAPDGYDWELQVDSDNLQVVISSLSPANTVWKGGESVNWGDPDGTDFNWATDDTGATSAGDVPGVGSDVAFNTTGAGNLATVLDADYIINSLTYNALAGSVTITPDTIEYLTVNYGITNNSSNEQVIAADVELFYSQTIDAATADITLNGAVDALESLTKTGAAPLNAPLLTVTDALEVNGGTLDPSGGTLTTNSLSIGVGSTTGTVDFSSGTVDVTDFTLVGAGGDIADTQSGTLNISGGDFYNEGDVKVGDLGAAGASGELNLSGGTLYLGSSIVRWFIIGDYGTLADATVNVTGSGLLQLQGGSNIRFLADGGTQLLDVNGGTVDGDFDVTAADYYMWMGPGTVTVRNSGQITDFGRIDLSLGTLNIESAGLVETLGGLDAWEGEVNINTSGVLETAWVASGTGTAGKGVVNVDGGTIRASETNATFFNFWNNAEGIVIGAGGLTIDTNGFDIGYSPTGNNPIAGTGGLTKTGAGTLSLANAANTYTGDTTVNGGTLAVDGSSLADSGTLDIVTGGVVEPTGTEVVAVLEFDGVAQATGMTYGATGSGADVINDTFFSGTAGVVSVGVVASGFEAWISGFTVADATPSGNSDADTLANVGEYWHDNNPEVSEGSAVSVVETGGNLELTFQRSDVAQAAGDVTVFVEYGSDLAGWTAVEVPAASSVVGGVTFTITDGSPTDTVVASVPITATEFFARLKYVK